VRYPSADEIKHVAGGSPDYIGLIRVGSIIKLLGYSDRRSHGGVFKELTCHSLWYANATVRGSKRWNISLVHCVTAPEEHRVRHPRAIEMGSFRLVVLT
jgi:hypothetical protein